MSSVNVNIKLNQGAINNIAEVLKKSALATMESFRDDIVTSQVMPFDLGTLQNEDTFTAVSSVGEIIRVWLITGNSYARYQYYGVSRKGNPLNYQTINNPNARSHWLEPYLDGEFLKETFQNHVKKYNKGGG